MHMSTVSSRYLKHRYLKVLSTIEGHSFDNNSRVRAPLKGSLLNRKRGSTAHSLSLSSANRPDMTEILMKMT